MKKPPLKLPSKLSSETLVSKTIKKTAYSRAPKLLKHPFGSSLLKLDFRHNGAGLCS